MWDKDRRLDPGHPLRGRGNVTVCEPALRPTPGAVSLLFPVDDSTLDRADPVTLAARCRPLPLVYVGNQYDRDHAFGTFFASPAAHVPHRVAGKWTDVARWPHVNFTGRCGFAEVAALYRAALATVLLLPDRYARAGQMTQRIFEAVLEGCLPITPATITDAGRFTPAGLHARTGAEVTGILDAARSLAGGPAHAALLTDCLRSLDIFRLSRQLTTLTHVLEDLTHAPGPPPPASASRP